MSIKQFSGYWASQEDRVVLKLNTTENHLFGFLFTRAMVRNFLEQSQLIVEQELSREHSERSSKIIQEFQKEHLKKQLSFEDTFEGGTELPLGDIPLLIVSIDTKMQNRSIAIALVLANNQVASFEIPFEQLQALMLLFEELANQASWNLSLDGDGNSVATVNVPVTFSSQIH
jgi:hypothetical protein